MTKAPEGIAAPLEPTRHGSDAIKFWRESQPFSWDNKFTFAEAYAAAVSKNLREELAALRSGARTGLLKFMMAGEVGQFADKMRNLLQAEDLHGLNNSVKDFFNYAKDQTERGWIELRYAHEQIDKSQARILELEKEIAALPEKLEKLSTYCFNCGTKLEPHCPAIFAEGKEVGRQQTDHKWCPNCLWVASGYIRTILG